MDEPTWNLPGCRAYTLIGKASNARVGPGVVVALAEQLLKNHQQGIHVNVFAEDKDLADWLFSYLSVLERSGNKPPELAFRRQLALDQIDFFWSNSTRQLLGKLSGAEIIGRAKLCRNQLQAIIPAFDLGIEELEFSEEEFSAVKEELERTRRLYNRLGPIDPAVQVFNSGIFRYQSLEDSRVFIVRSLGEFSERTEQLYRAYSLALDRFGRHFEADDAKRVRAAFALVQNCQLELAQSLELNTRKARERAKQTAWTKWREAINELGLFDIDESIQVDRASVDDLQSSLRNYLRKSKEYHQQRRRRLREAALGLSPVSLAGKGALRQELSRLEKERQALFSDLNESGLFQLPLKEDAATSMGQYKSLESLIVQFRRSASLLKKYEEAYKWQANWFNLRPPTRRILRTLMPLPSSEWLGLFETWYLERVWQQKGDSSSMFPTTTERLALAAAIDELRFYPAGFEVPDIRVMGEETPEHQVDVQIRCYKKLPDSHTEMAVDQERVLLFALLPNAQQSANYMVLSARDWPAGLALLQHWKSATLPDWSIAEAWPEVHAHCFSVGPAPVDYRGAWPPSITEGIKSMKGGASGSLPFFNMPTFRSTDVRQTGAGSISSRSFPDEKATDQPISLFIGRPSSSASILFSLIELVVSGRPIHLVFGWEEKDITQQLLQDGFDWPFFVAALIRAAQASESNDRHAFKAIADECLKRLGILEPSDHPLVLAVSAHLPADSFSINMPWRSTFLPLVVSSSTSGRRTIILPDGRLPGDANPREECLKQAELQAVGFEFYDLLTHRVAEEWEIVLEEIQQLAR